MAVFLGVVIPAKEDKQVQAQAVFQEEDIPMEADILVEECIQVEADKVVLLVMGTLVKVFQLEEDTVVLLEMDIPARVFQEDNFQVEGKVALQEVVLQVAVFLKVTIAAPILVLIRPEIKHLELPEDILEMLVASLAILILLKQLLLEEAKVLDLSM